MGYVWVERSWNLSKLGVFQGPFFLKFNGKLEPMNPNRLFSFVSRPAEAIFKTPKNALSGKFMNFSFKENVKKQTPYRGY